MSPTKIQQFYKDKTIFITGGTGFLGKLLVEKLLRSCSDVKKIILPIRPKINASIEKRISEFFDDTLFNIIRIENPSIMRKVYFINTEMEQENFGLSFSEFEIIRTTVNIIFHSAAITKFEASLSKAININVKMTKNVIDMAKKMEELEALIYVSTAWSHSIKSYTEEKVYNLSYKADFLLNLVNNIDKITLSNMTPILLNKWPNTYIMSKNVSECLIAEQEHNFPIAIFRPGAVVPTYREPIPGWVNDFQTISLFGIGIATGSIKVLLSNVNYSSHLVPADLVVNCMIAIAWNTACKNGTKELKIYNYSPMTNPCNRKTLYDGFLNTKYPLECIIWKPGYTTTNSKWLFDIYFFLYHTIPAIVADIIMTALKKKAVFRKLAQRTNKMLKSCSYFILNDFKFEFKNVPILWSTLHPEDKILFNFDLNSIDWTEYIDVWTKGVKTLLKEDFNNIKICDAKRLKLQVAHYSLFALLLIFGMLILFNFYILG